MGRYSAIQLPNANGRGGCCYPRLRWVLGRVNVVPMRRLAVAVAVLALGAAAPTAQAVTPAQARDAAARVLMEGAWALDPQPEPYGSAAQRRRFRPAVAIHRLKRILPRGTRVGQGVINKVRLLRGRTILFWGDYAPGGAFVHPSRLAFINPSHRTGCSAPTTSRGWPEVNGKRVFVRGRGRPRGRPLDGAPGRCPPRFSTVTASSTIVATSTVSILPEGHRRRSRAWPTRHGMPVAAARRVS